VLGVLLTTGEYATGLVTATLAAGFGVLCLYAAIALGLAAWLLRRRDA